MEADTRPVNIVVLAGGVGAARFLAGLRTLAVSTTAIVNTADDVTLHGLRVCPDLDSVMYTLGGGSDTERGWGRANETFTVLEELRAYGVEPTWFALGDRDIATHLIRTQLLDSGVPLSQVTQALCDRWKPGVRLLPMSDDRVETHVVVADGPHGARRALHFQEWWVRFGAEVAASEFVQIGAEEARPGPAVLDAIASADAILVAPSNPVVSVAPILRVPGLLDAVRSSPARVVGVSPIVAGRAVRGMAQACLSAVGVATRADAVGRWYGARQAPVGSPEAGEFGLLDGWLVHDGDPADVPGVTVRARPLMMTDVSATEDIARAALQLAGLQL